MTDPKNSSPKPARKKTDGKPSTPQSARRPEDAPVTKPAELAAAAKETAAAKAKESARKRPARNAIRKAASRHPAGKRNPQLSGPSLRAVPDLPVGRDRLEIHEPDLDESEVTPAQTGGAAYGTEVIEKAIHNLVGMLRTAGQTAGLEGDELEARIAQTLGYLRRRVTGDYEVDEFGFDREFTEEFWLPLLRPLYQRWFRVEVHGIENVPSEGGALVVANHSGTVPVDGLMLQVALHDHHPAHRHVRMLGADLVFQSPIIGEMARKAGSTLAAAPDAERLLSSGHLTAVFPEGFKGVGKPFSDRYRLQRFGRGGFVSAALKTGVPIIPCSIVGAEEIFPMIGNAKSLARVLGFPYFPITATFPWLGPLGMVPLPSKWIIEFGAPIETSGFGPEAVDDPMLTFDLTDQVRETIQQTLYSLLLRRRSVFF